MNSQPILELEQVSVVAPIRSDLLLNNLSFRVKAGTFLAIVGPSGAGKTTLLRVLNRLLEPSSGRIFFQGKPLVEIPVINLRRRLVLVPQEPKLLGMTVQDTLAYPLQLLQKTTGEIKAAISECLSTLHIPLDWLERYETQLSLGQRQLVCLGRALLLKPDILLLDEPTSALDVGTANHSLGVLRELTNHGAMTVIMVNHQLDLLRSFAAEILYLQNGHMEEIVGNDRLDWQELRAKLIRAESDKVALGDWD